MCIFNGSSNERKIIKEEREILLKLGPEEFDLIYDNIDKDLIKKLIFSKCQDKLENWRGLDNIF